MIPKACLFEPSTNKPDQELGAYYLKQNKTFEHCARMDSEMLLYNAQCC